MLKQVFYLSFAFLRKTAPITIIGNKITDIIIIRKYSCVNKYSKRPDGVKRDVYAVFLYKNHKNVDVYPYKNGCFFRIYVIIIA